MNPPSNPSGLAKRLLDIAAAQDKKGAHREADRTTAALLRLAEGQDPYDLNELNRQVEQDQSTDKNVDRIWDALFNGEEADITPNVRVRNYTPSQETEDPAPRLPRDAESISLWADGALRELKVVRGTLEYLQSQGVQAEGTLRDIGQISEMIHKLFEDVGDQITRHDDRYDALIEGDHTWFRNPEKNAMLERWHQENDRRVQSDFLPRMLRLAHALYGTLERFAPRVPFGPYSQLWGQYLEEFKPNFPLMEENGS